MHGARTHYHRRMASTEIEALVQQLARLPGLGPRSARRAVLHLMKKRESAFVPLLAARVGADRAGVVRVDIAADAAGDEPFGHRLERGEQRHERRLALLHQVQNRTPRRTRAEARQAGELLDECLYLLRCHDGWS